MGAPRLVRSFFARYQEKSPPLNSVLEGIGACIAILVVGAITHFSGHTFIIASFGASCVLLFSFPDSPIAKPVNVIGGHLLTTAIGLLTFAFLPAEWWSVSIAIGASVTMMAFFRLTHPPAGGNPLALLAAGEFGLDYLVMPILAGSVTIVVIAAAYNKATQAMLHKVKP